MQANQGRTELLHQAQTLNQSSPYVVLLHQQSDYDGNWSILPALPWSGFWTDPSMMMNRQLSTTMLSERTPTASVTLISWQTQSFWADPFMMMNRQFSTTMLSERTPTASVTLISWLAGPSAAPWLSGQISSPCFFAYLCSELLL
ncbi:unnamed protein product [Leuciscus chuanchicus]